MDEKNRIRALVQGNNLADAKSLCISFCESNPDDAEAWFLHGMLNGILKDFAGAEVCYNHVIRLMPEVTAAYYNKGIALQALKKYDMALLAFNKVIELEPLFDNIYAVIAEVYSALGDYDSAINSYEVALSRSSDNIPLLYKKGKLLLQYTKYQDAEDCFRKIISLNENHEEARFDLAYALQLQGNLDEAEIEYKNTIKLRPAYAHAYNNLGILYKEKELLEPAVECFSKAVQYDASSVSAYSNLGHALQLLDKYEAALVACKKANELKPNDPEINYSLGLQYEKLGQYPSARHCFNQASLLDKSSIRYPLVLARVFALERNFTEAIALYKSVIDKDASFVESYSSLGKIYIEIGETDLAIEYFKKILAIESDHLTANYYLAELDPAYADKKSQSLFIEKLFDGYANSFESDLVNKLHYQTPKLIYETAIENISNSTELVVFDLGCGTGLCGQLFRRHAARLVGVDLSPKIIEKARDKNVYDELYIDELTAVLEKENDDIDLILAADVFVYIGDLTAVFNAVKAVIKPEGLFVFSVEDKDGESYQLRSTGRFSHSIDYIKTLAARVGLMVMSHTSCVLRKEYGAEVPGVVYVLKSACLNT